ncbi:PREDICTED: metaxin-2-like [Priapulus caudatus]|uniref:Metaxin-2-like n=1 Tax=Priapulus caudatus TaxID=37621 RepID=A0ABM1EAN7_PRICU|nr:PREDICTED: metaxin-2-like [Priapulus caudatus]
MSILTESIEIELGASEPWPRDAQLYEPLETQMLLPDIVRCRAVEAFLNMCHLDFEVVHRKNAEDMSPSGMVPFVRCGAFIISELEPIVGFCGTKGHALTEDLSPRDVADMRAYMALLENTFGNAELYMCWMEDTVYQQFTRPSHESIYPWPLGQLLTIQKQRHTCQKLKSLDWAEKSTLEVIEDVTEACQAISEKLARKDFFCGETPTELDALAYAHLHTMLTVKFSDDRLAEAVKQHENLVKFVERITETFFTQH